MPKSPPYELAVFAALLLASCGHEPSYEVAEANRIAGLEVTINQQALASSHLLDRLQRDEARLGALETAIRGRR